MSTIRVSVCEELLVSIMDSLHLKKKTCNFIIRHRPFFMEGKKKDADALSVHSTQGQQYTCYWTPVLWVTRHWKIFGWGESGIIFPPAKGLEGERKRDRDKTFRPFQQQMKWGKSRMAPIHFLWNYDVPLHAQLIIEKISFQTARITRVQWFIYQYTTKNFAYKY